MRNLAGPEAVESFMIAAKKILVGVGGVVLSLVAIGVLLPPVARIERAIHIDTHRATVFALVNDFRQINKWASRFTSDPNVRIRYDGPPRGVGAAMSWSGSVIGQGTQSIVESVPSERVVTQTRSDTGEARTSFHLSEADGGADVIWRYERDFGLNIVGRYYGLLLAGIVGRELAAGLDGLKRMAESLPPSDFSDLEVEHMIVEAADIAYMPTSSEPLARAISEALGDAYFQVLSFIDEHGLKEAGAPMSISRACRGAELRFDAGVPVSGIKSSTPRAKDSVRIGKSYGGPVIRVKHIGSYVTLGRTHDKIAAYLAALGLERNGDAWESYVSDPTRTASEELLTYVYYPIRPDR